MQAGHGASSSLPSGPVPVSVSVPAAAASPTADQEDACGQAVAAAEAVVPDESLLWLLETAVAQLHQVVEELIRVGSGTRQVAERIGALQAIEWESPAGAAFAERNQRLRVRAEELARTADEQTALARTAIEDLHQRIQRLRADLAAARTVVTTVATMGAC